MVYGKHESRFAFTGDDDARRKMTKYIREKFSDILGDDQALLDDPNGLDLLQAKVQARIDSYRTPLSKAA